MNRTIGKLQITKRPFMEWVTLFIFVMPFFLTFLIDLLQIPDAIKYSLDVAWVMAFVCLFFKRRITFHKKIVPFVAIIGILFAYAAMVYIFRFQSPFYFLWGFRNNFRFYIAFLAFVVFLEEQDIALCFKLIDILFWINAAVSFVQFFFLGYQQDHLGGIFGVEKGCNGYSILFFALVLGRSILLYMNGTEKMWTCFLKCSITLIISAMAELKFFFIIFVFILVAAAFLTKFSWRKILTLAFAGGLLFFSGSILTIIFGENEALTFERIMQLITSSNYGTSEDLGRFTAIPTISNMILTEPIDRLFGLGLGNCDTSAFAICNTPFFQTYGGLHYNWFSSAILYLEMGYVGLALYLLFFIVVFVLSIRAYRQKTAAPLYCQLAIIFSILCIILTFYNSTMRRETAYMAYFVLALPWISSKITEKI